MGYGRTKREFTRLLTEREHRGVNLPEIRELHQPDRQDGQQEPHINGGEELLLFSAGPGLKGLEEALLLIHERFRTHLTGRCQVAEGDGITLHGHRSEVAVAARESADLARIDELEG